MFSIVLNHLSNASQAQKSFSSERTDLVGQCGDDDAQVGQGAVDGRHLLKALTLRLTLHHSFTASQVHQAKSGYTDKNKQKYIVIKHKYTYTVKYDFPDILAVLRGTITLMLSQSFDILHTQVKPHV